MSQLLTVEGMLEFKGYGKIPRLHSPCVVTEKIDGTNGAVVVADVSGLEHWVPEYATVVTVEAGVFAVAAQSRHRFISGESDNHGFGAWVRANAADLAAVLGPGRHFGEWWGPRIQRGYGVARRYFSLFDAARYEAVLDDAAAVWASGRDPVPPAVAFVLRTAPVLFEGSFTYEDAVTGPLERLRKGGSVAAFGFARPEGIVIHWPASGARAKVTLDGDGPKSVSGMVVPVPRVA